uniref:Tumor necrosis factor ligand superfamily member 6-like n=1 Tax=Neolamprologus brichardi TaxID=32507 RepID=A0A3Q4MH42_NEOBR
MNTLKPTHWVTRPSTVTNCLFMCVFFLISTAGSAALHEKAVMRRKVSDPPLQGMIDKDGGLIIPKEGNYFVYSKVPFSDSGVFQHSVTLSSKKSLKNVPLLRSRKHPTASKESGSDSFLSGIFHLNEHDRIFVTVNNISKIVQNNTYFGAVML